MTINVSSLVSPENKQQRVFVEDRGTIWLHFKDLCKNLDFANTTQTVSRYDLSMWIKQMSDGSIGYPPLWIKEEGAYLLMFESNTLQAQNFKYWLATKVLPDIRKTGMYNIKHSDDQNFNSIGLSLGEKAQELISNLMDKIETNIEDPLAVNRYSQAIDVLNATLHRNQPPPKVKSSSSSKHMADFLSNHIQEAKGDFIKASELYKAYLRYCRKNNYKSETITSFGRHAATLFEKKRCREGVIYLDVKLV